MTVRVLSLCVDDFGQSPGIAAAVGRLARVRRITAVSCITNAPGWRRDAPLLREIWPTVATGLHLNLTEGRPLSAQLARVWPQLPSLPRLLWQTHLRLVSRLVLVCEMRAQWHTFEAACGRAPDFIDGHQHVHHLPVVRDAMLEVLDELQVRPAVRSTARVLGPAYAFKRWMIQATGGQALERQLDLRQLAHNTVLLGAYDFRTADYRARMQAWLTGLPSQGGLLFCHPGAAEGLDATDAIAAARTHELAYLSGEAFAQDLADAQVVLGNTWVRNTPARVAAPFSEMSRPG
jgi:predicted glycoside hydrolase/deacetylase ChbG (UPF0249 family)